MGERTTGLEPATLELGKLALYQLSYVRVAKFLIPKPS